MHSLSLLTVGMAAGLATLTGCSSASKTPDVSSEIRKALDQAGFKDVSESQNRDKGVITLGGHVSADADKDQAERIARSFAETKSYPTKLPFFRRDSRAMPRK